MVHHSGKRGPIQVVKGALTYSPLFSVILRGQDGPKTPDVGRICALWGWRVSDSLEPGKATLRATLWLSCDALNLREGQDHVSASAEEIHARLEATMLGIGILNDANNIGEGAIKDQHIVA